jgi:hypothetical protein
LQSRVLAAAACVARQGNRFNLKRSCSARDIEGLAKRGVLGDGWSRGCDGTWEGLRAMTVDLKGSHASIEVDDKLKTYAMFLGLIKYGIVGVAIILLFMLFYLV